MLWNGPSLGILPSLRPTEVVPPHLGVGTVPCGPWHLQCMLWGSSPACSPLPVHSSMFYDEDGDLAHEFYEETIVTKNGQKRAKLRRVHKNLIPQGIVKLDPPRIHVDFPVILYEV